MTHIKMIENLQEGIPVQWVGVYALNWRMEWGLPSVGFVMEDNPLLDSAPEMLEALKWILGMESSAECYADHHGLCQAHRLDPIEKCWVKVCEEAIAKAEGGREQ